MPIVRPLTTDLGGGRKFIGEADAIFPERLPYPDISESEIRDDESFVRALTKLWEASLQAKAPEFARLHRLEKFYRGWHYREAPANFEMEVTNLCFSGVETVWPILVNARRRPRIIPRRPTAERTAKARQEFAQFLMDAAGTNRVRRRNDRVKLKYGYAVYLVTAEERTGMPYVVDWSVWNSYRDPNGRDLHSCEYHILASPVATRLLRSMYPDKADQIRPDFYVAPSYDVMVREEHENLMFGTGSRAPSFSGPLVYRSGESQPAGSTSYVFGAPNEYRHDGLGTTFTFQFFIRDRLKVAGKMPGTVLEPPIPGDTEPIEVPGQYHDVEAPCCDSGWRFVSVTSAGVILEHLPLDPCFDGLPILYDHDYEHEERLEGIGEQDMVIPINRALNERKNSLNQSLRLSARPVFRASKGSGLRLEGKAVAAGDVLEPSRASDIGWLEYDGPREQHFAHVKLEQADAQLVGGWHDVIRGQRPVGIETGVAIEKLQAASGSRIQGKNHGALDVWAAILRKMMKIAAAKLDPAITFLASDGNPLTVTRADLDDVYDVRMTDDSDVEQSREQFKELVLQLGGMGYLSPMEVLRQLEYPDWQKAAAEAIRWQMLQAAAAQTQENGARNGGAGAKNQRGGARAGARS